MKADVLAVFFGVGECSRRKDISNVMNEAKCPTAVKHFEVQYSAVRKIA